MLLLLLLLPPLAACKRNWKFDSAGGKKQAKALVSGGVCEVIGSTADPARTNTPTSNDCGDCMADMTVMCRSISGNGGGLLCIDHTNRQFAEYMRLRIGDQVSFEYSEQPVQDICGDGAYVTIKQVVPNGGNKSNPSQSSRNNTNSATPMVASTAQLSNDNAQRTLNKWIGDRGSVSLKGIREVPQENVATAELYFGSFRRGGGGKIGRGDSYEGPATAVFVHYNDGRWILRTITFGDLRETTFHPDIEVR